MKLTFLLSALLMIAMTGAGQVTTAENGLNTPNATTVQLGGSLLHSTSIDQGTGFNIHFKKGSTYLFSINNNGNIGLGTGEPGTFEGPGARLSFPNLHLSDDPIGMTWYNPDPINYAIHRTAGPWSSPNYQQLRLGWLTGIVLDPGVSYGKSYVDIVGNGLRVTSGNVGIGTTNPGTLLSLGSSSNNSKLAIWEGDIGGQLYRCGLGVTSGMFRFFVPGPGSRFSFLSDEAGTNEIVTIQGTGNVGIGNVSPVEKLQVNGNVYSTGFKLDAGKPIYWDDPNTSITRAGDVLRLREYTGQIDFTGQANLLVSFTHPTNGSVDFSFPAYRVFALRNKEAYVLQTSASHQNECWIKLGATSPHYADGPGTRLYLFGGKGGDRGALNGGDVFIDGGEKGSASAQDGNILIASQHGNVGIGTTNITGTGYKLYVDGNIRTRRVRVDQDTWADYVFESNYKLRPIQEVEQYIQKEKHLPDVPSAAEVKKEGLDLGDNQAVLLKKIEELTLYIIQLQKQVDVLEKKVNGNK